MNWWLTIYRGSCVIFVGILLVGVVCLFLPKIRTIQERQRKQAAMEANNRAMEEKIKQVQKQKERFLTDPKYVEKVAREELGKAKPGETIYRFNERKTNDYHPQH